MKLLKLAFSRETAMPLYTLSFASAVSLGLVFARVLWTRNLHYGFLFWNLFLAWLPLAFALLARDNYEQTSGRNWRFLALAGAWLLFFPNAPYIFTDVIHLTRGFYRHFWVDLTLILSCALTGLVVGFLSLYIMHSVAKNIVGRWGGWMFIAAVAGLPFAAIFERRRDAKWRRDAGDDG